MQKVIYALWRDPGESIKAFNDRLRGDVASRLAASAHAVRVNVQDEAVEGGASPRMVATRPQMDAVVQVWMDSANDHFRQPFDEIIGSGSARYAAWLVAESVAIPNTLHPPRPGERTEGFSQIVFLGKPPRLTWEAWRHTWEHGQTSVAIETQANFEYVQNLVVRPLTYGAGDYAAVVEECFPAKAFYDEAVYFDAVGDDAKLKDNQARMAESCARFIDFDRIDCIPTSQYEIKALR